MKIKNNKGFSLIELLVAMGLIGVLTAIAIPAYDNYRETANDTVLKSDVGNGYKAMHAYNAVNNKFCAKLDALGLKALKTSTTYTTGSNSFIGFGAKKTGECSAHNTTQGEYLWKKGTTISASSCTLGDSSFVLGVSNTFGGTTYGYNISHNDNSPKAKSGGTCNNNNCKNKAECEAALSSHTSCATPAGQTANGVWTPGTTIADLCSN